jgi:HD-like signal output (HDOD) protein
VVDAERHVLMSRTRTSASGPQSWCLDDSLCRCIRDHHGPSGHRGAELVNLAYVLTQARNIGSPGDPSSRRHPRHHRRHENRRIQMLQILRDLDKEYQTVEPCSTS